MSYTSLRVTSAGVVLFEEHARRLAPEGGPALAAYRRFAQTASPGGYRLWAENGALRVEAREEGPPLGGQPVRFVLSPFADRRGRFPKPAPPNAYQAVRLPGVTTVLTSPDGAELYESCVAALVGFDGRRFVLPPLDRPAVASAAAAALEQAGPVERAPVLRDATAPLALVNAVRGVIELALPGRAAFPVAAREAIAALLRARTSRG